MIILSFFFALILSAMRRRESQEWRQKVALPKSSTASSPFELARFTGILSDIVPCQRTDELLSYPLQTHGHSTRIDERVPHSWNACKTLCLDSELESAQGI